MNRRRMPTAAVGALVALALSLGGFCGYLVGRKQASLPDDPPTAERRAAPAPERDSEEDARRREEDRAANAQQRRTALREVESRDAETRAWCLRTLVEAGYDHAKIVRLVVRPKVPDWQGRALADLLSSAPHAALPPLLHRLTHSAPEQRARICDALGAPREDTTAAAAILAVRALLDSFDGVREPALAALQEVAPAAADAVLAHYAKGPELSDGSVAGLDASLLIEEGCPFASGRSRRMFLDALRADGDRFGHPTVIRVGALLAPLPGGSTWFTQAARGLLAYDGHDPERAALFAGVGPGMVPLLRRRLMVPGAQDDVATVLGHMGTYARSAVPDLLHVVAERRPIWRSALRAAARLSGGDESVAATEADVGALLSFLHDEEMGAHVAWALGHVGPTSPEVLEALCVRLAHRITMGLRAEQAEGTLKRLLARGQGFDEVTALLPSDHQGVLRAAIRILSLCHERDREAARALLEDLGASAPSRAVRRAVERALKLLSAEGDVREAERRWQLSGLARQLEAE